MTNKILLIVIIMIIIILLFPLGIGAFSNYRFKLVYEQNIKGLVSWVSIIKDTETGVKYLIVEKKGALGVTRLEEK